MSKAKAKDTRIDTLELNLELETPETMESPQAGTASLISDQIPSMAARLSVLESMVSLLVRDLSFDDFMREILMTVMKTVTSEAGSLLEVDHDKSALFFRAAAGYSSDQIVHYTVPLGKGIAGHVTESKEPYVVSDVKESQIHLKAIQKAVGFNARNLVAVPIIIRGKVFAVLELLNRVGESGYSTSDVELLTQICSYLSKVIETRLMLGWGMQARNNRMGRAA